MSWRYTVSLAFIFYSHLSIRLYLFPTSRVRSSAHAHRHTWIGCTVSSHRTLHKLRTIWNFLRNFHTSVHFPFTRTRTPVPFVLGRNRIGKVSVSRRPSHINSITRDPPRVLAYRTETFSTMWPVSLVCAAPLGANQPCVRHNRARHDYARRCFECVWACVCVYVFTEKNINVGFTSAHSCNATEWARRQGIRRTGRGQIILSRVGRVCDVGNWARKENHFSERQSLRMQTCVCVCVRVLLWTEHQFTCRRLITIHSVRGERLVHVRIMIRFYHTKWKWGGHSQELKKKKKKIVSVYQKKAARKMSSCGRLNYFARFCAGAFVPRKRTAQLIQMDGLKMNFFSLFYWNCDVRVRVCAYMSWSVSWLWLVLCGNVHSVCMRWKASTNWSWCSAML